MATIEKQSPGIFASIARDLDECDAVCLGLASSVIHRKLSPKVYKNLEAMPMQDIQKQKQTLTRLEDIYIGIRIPAETPR